MSVLGYNLGKTLICGPADDLTLERTKTQGRQRLTPVHLPLHSAGRSTNAVQRSVRAGLLLLMMLSAALRSAALRRSTRGYAGRGSLGCSRGHAGFAGK